MPRRPRPTTSSVALLAEQQPRYCTAGKRRSTMPKCAATLRTRFSSWCGGGGQWRGAVEGAVEGADGASHGARGALHSDPKERTWMLIPLRTRPLRSCGSSFITSPEGCGGWG